MNGKRRLPALVAGAALLLGACYEYVPVEPATPTAGTIVRADVTGDAAARLTGILGPGVLSVHGMVLRQEDAAVEILVDNYATRLQGELAAQNEPVLLAYPEISTLGIKTLAKKRSAIFGAALAAGAALTAVVFTDLGRHLTNEPNDTTPTQEFRSGFRIPIGLRIPLSIR